MKNWKSDQKIVMDEVLVQNGVMDEKFVKNFVTDAKIDPKVVMALSMFKTGGWKSLQPVDQGLLEEFVGKKELSLLIAVPSKDPFFVTQYLARHCASSDQHMKKLMSLREGLHVMMECYVRQHFADRYWLHEHPGGHATWREPALRKFTKELTSCFVKRICRSEDAIKFEWICSENKGFFHKQLENQNSLGELP